MPIVFDGRWIDDEMSGIGRYSQGLLGGLASITDRPPIVVLGGRRDRISTPALSDAQAGLTFLPSRLSPMSPRNQWTIPRLLRKLGASVYHAPYVHAPLLGRDCRVVITVHDLIPQRFPEGLARSRKVRHRRLWQAWCAQQYRRADAIVTVSDFSRRELIDHAAIAPGKVVRIYNGVEAEVLPTGGVEPALREALRQRFGINGRIISYFGRHDPYKNIAGLIRAFEILRRRRDDVTLVIGGRIDPRYPEPRQAAGRPGLVGRVVFTDYLDDRDRASLLAMSDVFVFPSRYEGFGLPPLEAMAAGVPVVASNATSIPEVVGDAALQVDPDDVEGMAEAILRLLDDEALRARLIHAGRARAATFTWQRCAREHLDLYQRLL